MTLADRAATGSSSTLTYGSLGGGATSGASSRTKGGSHRKDGPGGTVLHFENPTYWKEDEVRHYVVNYYSALTLYIVLVGHWSSDGSTGL